MDKNADIATEIEVDESILDYLAFTAIKALLDDTQGQRHASRHELKAAPSLNMLDSFLTIFNYKHPQHTLSPNIRFRIRLLKFTSLFTQRLRASETSPPAPSLQSLCRRNRKRAQTFLSHQNPLSNLDLSLFEKSPPFPDHILLTNRTRLLSPAFPSNPPPPPSISLLETLPLFMALSAAQTILSSSPVTELWMRLAARYMMQAILEQYLVYGARGIEAIQEACAYGFDVEDSSQEEDAEAREDDLQVANMFWSGEGTEEVGGWAEIRGKHLSALVLPEGTSLLEHLQRLESEQLGMVEFERYVAEFLGGLMHAQPKPLLVQLEEGRVHGLGKRETQRLKERVGWI